MKESISIRLEKHILDEVDRLAREEGTSRTEVIREALRVFFRTRESAKDRSFVPFEEYKKLTDEVSATKYRIGEIQAKLELSQKEKERLVLELEGLKREIGNLKGEVDKKAQETTRLNKELNEKLLLIKELELRIEVLNREKDELMNALQAKKRWKIF